MRDLAPLPRTATATATPGSATSLRTGAAIGTRYCHPRHTTARLTPNSDGGQKNYDDESVNPGSNLFVTGIHPRLEERDVHELFAKHGDVEKCNIMRDPHTRDSRGFGFVKMVTGEDADKVKDALQGEVIEGRTLSIEKARRAKPRTPTPGKYFGPPKRGLF